MNVTCPDCQLQYDDVYRLTTCPHDVFEMRTFAARYRNGEVETRVCTNLDELREFMA